jgi:alpha-L-fucosidase
VKAWERGRPNEIQPQPFEADTCIGDWHYKKDITYKTVREVVQMLVDVVSKNGTMLLSIPLRGDGTIDEREEAFLHGLAGWMSASSEGIFGSRPWKVYGEGPTLVPRGRDGDKALPYTAADVRFTAKNGALYIFVLSPPTGPVTVRSLGRTAALAPPIEAISLVGSEERIRWRQDADALVIEKPLRMPAVDVISFRVSFGLAGLTSL